MEIDSEQETLELLKIYVCTSQKAYRRIYPSVILEQYTSIDEVRLFLCF